MYTYANRSNRIFACPLDADGNKRDLISGVTDSSAVPPAWVNSVGRYGGGAYSFDSANRRMEYAGFSWPTDWFFGAWTRRIQSSATRFCGIFGQRGTDIENRCQFTIPSTNTLSFSLRIASTTVVNILTAAQTWNVGTWYYCYVYKTGTTWAIGRDGTDLASVTENQTMYAFEQALMIGNLPYTTDLTRQFNGYIQGVEISPFVLDKTGGERPLR